MSYYAQCRDELSWTYYRYHHDNYLRRCEGLRDITVSMDGYNLFEEMCKSGHITRSRLHGADWYLEEVSSDRERGR